MNIGFVTQSDVTQEEKNKYCIFMQYMWNPEKWYRWTYLQGRNRGTDVEKRYVDTEGEAEGGTDWEIRTDISTLSGVGQRANGKLPHGTGSSAQCYWWPRRMDGGRGLKTEGIFTYTEQIHFTVQQQLAQHYEATILQLKKRQCLSSRMPYILKRGIKNNMEKDNNFREW